MLTSQVSNGFPAGLMINAASTASKRKEAMTLAELGR
jgi:hypothetical protein